MNTRKCVTAMLTSIGLQCMPGLPLIAAEATASASFNIDTGILTLPVVQAGNQSFAATLALVPLATSPTGAAFELRNAAITTNTATGAATFNRQQGLVTLPAVDLVQGGNVLETISAEMDLVEGSTPFLFAVASVTESGKKIFRHVTFGDEQLWTDTLKHTM
ncbi:MAG: hypothetical protein RLZZ227_50 [Pseudomonadota bacterium]